ncbi:bacterioferritin [Candidatus Nitrospira nitrificans]|jgi:bacterioferritin|uniref:Bacterioferritin n=1 Tax=Candidatus Nitrospira nitrificans TaxID=1742973 RepID=A0A0S4LRN2_9BACT|nr:bacterioferritin [Candidatus Nitrospira nitrificans]CUS38635.1 Bacterioferritin [Candidatus Nitrospira nitrificans]
MKAKEGVLEFLNQVLRSELTAVHQYLLHAALCKNWGYERLQEHYSHLANEEVQHSAGLIDHILYLNGTPEVGQLDPIVRGEDVGTLFRADLDFERDDVELLRKAIAHCAKVGDFTTRHLLEHMIEDSEEHVDWFEVRLRTIDQVGLDRFLSEQIKK